MIGSNRVVQKYISRTYSTPPEANTSCKYSSFQVGMLVALGHSGNAFFIAYNGIAAVKGPYQRHFDHGGFFELHVWR